MDKAGVRAAFVAAGLSRLLKDIDFLAKDSIRLYAKPAGEYDISIGASRIGGVPDVPPDFKWPERNEVPQSFIAQLYLDEVHTYDINGALPSSGMLWFFYDAKQETYGADPADHGGWRVMFSDDYSGLQRIAAPDKLPAESQFNVCSVSFASEVTLSQSPELDIPDFDWTDDEAQKYETLLSTFPTPEDHGAVHHQLLGNAQTIQDDMRLECQLASHDITDINDPRAAEISKGANEWQLLLQIDSDERLGMSWGSAGMIYYWITESDMKAHKFEHSWLVLQSD
ncbi:MAG TPA: YwqG family protein [Ktedonobacteraceae bacterium]